MTMNRLWAPWRVKYIRRLNSKNQPCIFCHIYKDRRDARNFIFRRTKHCFAVLNIYPYNNGHILIVPNRHVSDLTKLKTEEKHDLFALLESCQVLLDKVLKPRGYNIGMNLGRIAGAGFPGHLHIHVVPRWGGDVNFMPVISNTKVISQSLKLFYSSLRKQIRSSGK